MLLVLDDYCPFEEQLHLALGRGARVLDPVVLGSIHTPGAYREIDSDADSLSFRFESAATWTVSATPHGTRGFSRLPSGARRRGGWFAPRYLSLSWQEIA